MYECRTILALASGLALALGAVPAAAATPAFTITRDVSIGGFKRDGFVRQAVSLFGNPASRTEEGYDRCKLTWPGRGITMISFYPQGDLDPCGASARHVSTTVTDRRWKTSVGLRIGDPVRRMRTLYKRALRDSGTSWILIARSFGGTTVPGLAADVRNGRVVSLTVYGPRLAF